MTLLLDAEARLFVIPQETRTEPTPAPPREPARRREATPAAPAARALSPAPPVSPATRAAEPPVAAGTPVATPSVEPLPEPATWAGAGEQRRTLDDLLSASWEGLSTESATAACPVCDGELVRRWSAGAGVVGGRCRDCGSELS